IMTRQLDTSMIHVESEFSALSVVMGSTLGGIRSFTATSSQGLLMMSEATYYASGMRIPLVMAVVNRGLSAPVTIFSDHQDSISLRDNGWLQFYCKDSQEALDTIITAYRIAEHKKVLLPIKVCIDGFFLSHLSEPVEIPSQTAVGSFLPEFRPNFPHMDIDDPKFLGTAAWPDYYEEFIFLRNKALTDAITVIDEVSKEYSKKIHEITSLISTYRSSDAEIVIIGLGAMMSTLEVAIDKMREKGHLVGLLRIKCFRPFPCEQILDEIKDKKNVVILDRSLSPSQAGPLFLEISSLLHTSGLDIDCYGFILGLGGRDITEKVGELIIKAVNELEPSSIGSRQFWLDVNHQTIKRWTANE
ncbi:MAG: pyruvate ferredoxin oxidoreductase, partial [Candidatus Heimdallarchaeota archaeon]|nr:pyruvate ferredoxin oxidoreductase [Candidatus Heimdallarchaeota archaeon]